MKSCTSCILTQSLDRFDKKNAGLRSICKSCVSVYSKQHYVKNRDYYLTKATINRRLTRVKLRKFLFNYYCEHPCVECSEADPIVLEFDHLHDKFDGIARMANRAFSIKRIQEEIDKCEVVCANCHRRRTAKKLNWYKGLVS